MHGCRNRVHLTKHPHDSGLYRDWTVSVGGERGKIAPSTNDHAQRHVSNQATDLWVTNCQLWLKTTTTLWPRVQPLYPDRKLFTQQRLRCSQTYESEIHKHTNMFNWKRCSHRDVTELSAPLMTAVGGWVGGIVILQSGLLVTRSEEAAVTPVGLCRVTWLRPGDAMLGAGWSRCLNLMWQLMGTLFI